MHPKRIYIIDDDQNFGRSLKRLMTIKGFQADYFGSAKAFLDSVPTGQKGIAVIDIHMPGISGFDLMDKMIRATLPLSGERWGFSRSPSVIHRCWI
jgi:FixJ family two-component response regulator